MLAMGRSSLSPFHSSSSVSMLCSGHHRPKSSSGDSGSGNSQGNFNFNFLSTSTASNSAFSQPLRDLEQAFKEAELRQGEGYRRGMMPNDNVPTCVDYAGLRMLISASPTVRSIARYHATLSKMGVKHVVRVCEPTYSANRLPGVTVHDWEFKDGSAPSLDIIDKWLDLVLDSSKLPENQPIAVHCRAGLGRAPVLVAIALIEKGMHPFEAAGTIRALRRGAINGTQMNFLENYTRRKDRLPNNNNNTPADVVDPNNIKKNKKCKNNNNNVGKKNSNPQKSKRRPFGWIKSRSAPTSTSPVAVHRSH